MAVQKITEKDKSNAIKESAYILVTQPEESDEGTKEVLVRIPAKKFEQQGNKDKPNGYPGLDENGNIPALANVISNTLNVSESTETITEKVALAVNHTGHYLEDGTLLETTYSSHKIGSIKAGATVNIHVWPVTKYPAYLLLDAEGNVVEYLKVEEEVNAWNDYEVVAPDGATTLIINFPTQTEESAYVTKTAAAQTYEKTTYTYSVKFDGLSQELKGIISKKADKELIDKPRPILFGKTDSIRQGTVMDIAVEGDITYVSLWRNIYKIKWEKEHTPVVEAYIDCTPTGKHATDVDLDEDGGYTKYYNSGAGFIPRKFALTEEYIYVALRYPGGIKTDETLYHGGLAVIRKADFTVVKTIWTTTLNTRVVVHGDILALGNQMHGLQFYDISDPANPILKSEILYNYGQGEDAVSVPDESQAGNFLELDGSLCYINIGFGGGFNIYNVDNITNPVLVKRWLFKNELGWSDAHTYDAVVNYPYMYMTMAYGGEDKLVEDHPERTGVITLDITDLANPIVLNVCPINSEDASTFNAYGDTKPTVIQKFNNTIVTNYENGILEFKVAEDGKSCIYLGKFKPTSDYAVYGLTAMEDGRFFVGGQGANTGTVFLYRGL